MLGEHVGESTGRITGMRVLPTEGQQVWLEVSVQGQGTLLGQPITDIGTYQGATGALARLLTVATAIEYEIAEDGAYRWTMWEWTGAGVAQPAAAGARA